MRTVTRAPARGLAATLLAALLALGLAAAAAENLPYAGMWWDESASFWGSQGLSRYAAPFAAPGSLADVVRMNRRENLDPGGFHLLLHFWTGAGKGLAWLRSLPFAFFVLGALLLGLLAWRLSGSGTFAVASAAVPLLVPGALYYAFEIRAFSMEAAGVAAGGLALVLALERPSPPRLLLLGVTCAAFLSSRYSFALTAAGLAAALAVASLRQGVGRRQVAARLATALVPVAAAGAAVALVTTAHQIWSEMRGGPLGVVSPEYTRASVLRGNPHAADLLLRNLLAPAALPITLAALFFLLLRRRAYGAAKRAGRAGDGERPAPALDAVFVSVFGIQGLSAAASLLGIYPWDVGSRWSAYLLMVAAVATVALAADAVALARIALGRRTVADRLAHAAHTAGVVIAVVVVTAGSARAMRHRQVVSSAHRTDLTLLLDRLPVARLRERCVFVTYYEVPVLRYLYEHGPYAGRTEYPRLFRFERLSEWNAAARIDADREGIEYVVTALPLAEAQARFPRVTLLRAGPGDCRLLRVVRSQPEGPPG